MRMVFAYADETANRMNATAMNADQPMISPITPPASYAAAPAGGDACFWPRPN